MKLKKAYLIPTVLFVLFALFQLNDPDPWLWVAIYLYAAICSLLAGFNRLSYVQVILGFCFYFFWLTYTFPEPDQWHFDAEEGREAMGLIICGNWVAFLGIIKLYRDSYN